MELGEGERRDVAAGQVHQEGAGLSPPPTPRPPPPPHSPSTALAPGALSGPHGHPVFKAGDTCKHPPTSSSSSVWQGKLLGTRLMHKQVADWWVQQQWPLSQNQKAKLWV